jgi:hypothetical protein
MWSQKRPNVCKSQERRASTWIVASARSAGLPRHDYFFILQKRIYLYTIYIQY